MDGKTKSYIVITLNANKLVSPIGFLKITSNNKLAIRDSVKTYRKIKNKMKTTKNKLKKDTPENMK